MPKKTDVYEIITDQIIKKLDEGTVPWRKTWVGGTPMNFKSKKPYRGLNALLLSMSEYDQPYWLTLKQANELGGKIRKGEKSTIVVFWKNLGGVKEVENEKTGEKELKSSSFFVLRYYRVFNLEQTEGIELPTMEHPNDTLEEAERIRLLYKDAPPISHGGGRACYRPMSDEINMPRMSTFENSEFYYSVLFHEMAHSTGHASRLDRKEVTNCQPYGTESYSKEELVAEFCSAFLCGHAGIAPDTVENSASYIESWRKALKEDKKLLVSASSKAQKASDYIMGTYEESEKK